MAAGRERGGATEDGAADAAGTAPEGAPVEAPVEAHVLSAIAQVDAAAWDRCAGDGNPFVRHAFLAALEDSGSSTAETGWHPRHIVLKTGDGAVLGAVPMYLKNHSYGEYVFDHGWADAFERAGGRYYPKLQVSVPFTPVTGPRLLAPAGPQADAVRTALLSTCVGLCDQAEVSSLHITFPTEAEFALMGDAGLLQRTGIQFHWLNQGYGSFDDFLATLASRKRKQIRRERQTVADAGLTIRALAGNEIEERHWDAFHAFYQATGSRKWGVPYLTRAFFSLLGERMADAVVLVMVERDGRPVAGRPQPRRLRCALRPQLGLHRGAPLPPFRGLLLPRHRLRHRPRAQARGGRRPGAAQAGAGLPAGADLFRPLGRRCGPAGGGRALPRPRDAGDRPRDRDSGAARPLPPGRRLSAACRARHGTPRSPPPEPPRLRRDRMEASNLDALTRDALDHYLFPLATKQDIRADGPTIFSSADGMEITDAAGKTYLDMMSTQTRASSLGYGQERIARAVYDQLMSLHYAGTFANVADVTVRLSARIADLAPGSLTATIFAGSGSEANEMSIKLAKQYHAAKGDKPRAHKIISRWNAYHGATMGVIGGTDYLGTRAITEPGVPGFSRIPAPNLYRTPFGMDPSEVCDFCVDFLEQHIVHEGPETVAAFIAEPVMQGDGVQVPPDDYFARVRAVCDKYDVLLIGDEVITGFGRTGRWFALEHWGVECDIMSTAKAITAGYFPLGASTASRKVIDALPVFNHVQTYNGHPGACAAALATIDILEGDNLIAQGAETGAYFLERDAAAARAPHRRRRARARHVDLHRLHRRQGDQGAVCRRHGEGDHAAHGRSRRARRRGGHGDRVRPGARRQPRDGGPMRRCGGAGDPRGDGGPQPRTLSAGYARITPGLRMPLGSSACLRVRMRAISSGVRASER